MAGVSEASLRALEEEAWEEWDGSGSFVHHCIAGAAAGVAEHVLMFPLDTYKVRRLCCERIALRRRRRRQRRRFLPRPRRVHATRPPAPPPSSPTRRRRTSSSPAGRGCRCGA